MGAAIPPEAMIASARDLGSAKIKLRPSPASFFEPRALGPRQNDELAASAPARSSGNGLFGASSTDAHKAQALIPTSRPSSGPGPGPSPLHGPNPCLGTQASGDALKQTRIGVKHLAEWNCGVCTYNNLADETACNMCGTPKPKPSVTPTAKLPSASVPTSTMVRVTHHATSQSPASPSPLPSTSRPFIIDSLILLCQL